uniref:Uncharacterized protein n=1 Tax=uncultured marine thaumarchaeote KM3_45_G08 TaxID=1456157 RepID=A0A075H9J9_9ARCH|nr:hypothetical protein [uncultured marine thaumarchaeote KM3_45_G08]
MTRMRDASTQLKVVYLHLIADSTIRRKCVSRKFTYNLSKRRRKFDASWTPMLKALRICPGSIKKHSTKLARSTATTTRGIATMISPITPEIIITGRKAATVVKLAETTGTIMYFAPATAASEGPRPEDRFTNACSPTTIASSTTIPIIIIIANKLTILIVWPVTNMAAKDPKIAVGIPTAIQKATREFKKTNNIPNTNAKPPRPFLRSKFIRSRIRSAATSNWRILKLSGSLEGRSFTYSFTLPASRSAS